MGSSPGSREVGSLTARDRPRDPGSQGSRARSIYGKHKQRIDSPSGSGALFWEPCCSHSHDILNHSLAPFSSLMTLIGQSRLRTCDVGILARLPIHA